MDWNLEETLKTKASKQPLYVCESIEDIISKVVKKAQSGDHIVIMSNGGFGGIHKKLMQKLEETYA
jgi:UDP-N-acetylmuramate: L-alanyl-gamma-D-glutamyl-meso-diaminopimelate ligase